MLRVRVSPIVVFFCVAAVVAPTAAGEPPRALVAQEEKALARVSEELLRLAKFCSANKAYGAARAELERGLAFQPDAERLRKHLEKIAGREDQAKPAFQKRLDQRRRKTHEKCVQLLSRVAKAFDKRGFPDRFDHHVALIRKHFPSKRALAAFDLVYFEPYLKWVRKQDVERLRKGGERVDGKWLDAAAVRALNGQHGSWTEPWVISDEVHEVRTTLPLRTARTILAHTSAFREFFLGLFKGAWDLQPPKGKLPVIVTDTQEELRARARAYTAGAGLGGMNGAAYYLWTNGSLNPCFVTFEPTDHTGATIRANLEGVLRSLRHELTHQIAFEYSKHDYDASRPIEFQFWSVEGIANFMQHYVIEDGTWRLTHPRRLTVGAAMVEGDFAWCVDHRNRLPRIETFMGLSRQQFMTVENYHVSATLAYFLLRGADGRYRKSFLKLLERVHKSRDSAQTLATCFPGVDWATMQREWERFVGDIRLE